MLTGSFCSVDGYKDRIHRSLPRCKFIVSLDNIQFIVDFDPGLLAHAIVCREYGRSDKSGGGKCHGLLRTWPHWFDFSLSNQPSHTCFTNEAIVPGPLGHVQILQLETWWRPSKYTAFPWFTEGWSPSGGYAAECPAESLIRYPEMIPFEVSPAEERCAQRLVVTMSVLRECHWVTLLYLKNLYIVLMYTHYVISIHLCFPHYL